jgi:hypothetical protein
LPAARRPIRSATTGTPDASRSRWASAIRELTSPEPDRWNNPISRRSDRVARQHQAMLISVIILALLSLLVATEPD